MSSPAHDERTLKRYLLRTLPEEERERLELDALRDEDLVEDLRALEDELFHDYAQGGLDPLERGVFERTLLQAPHGQARLDEARALLARLEAQPSASTSHAPVWWGIAAAIAIAAALWWLRAPQAGPDREAHLTPPPMSPPASPSVSAPPPPRTAGRVLVLALSPGAMRAGGSMPRVTAGADVSGLRLDLALPKSATAQSYSALLRTAEGVETWSARDLRVDPANRTMLPIELPLEGLPEADYELELSGEGPHGARRLAEYRFRLLRE